MKLKTAALLSALLLCACGGGGGSDAGGDDLSLSFAPSKVTGNILEGTSGTFELTAAVTGSVSGTVVVVTDSATVLEGAPVIQQQSSTTYLVTLVTRDDLAVGAHTGSFLVRLCSSSTCTTQYGSKSLPYEITVQPNETNLTPLTPWPGIADWSTEQGNAAHNGHVAVTLDTTKFKPRWIWDAAIADNLYIKAASTSSAEGLVFLTYRRGDGTGYVYAFREFDGTEAWKMALGSDFGHSPAPGTHDHKVYIPGVATPSGLYSLKVLDAATGSLLTETPLPSAYNGMGPSMSQPVFLNGHVYLNVDPVNGIVAVDGNTATLAWQSDSGGYYAVTPAADADHVYFYRRTRSVYDHPYDGVGFIALDSVDGSVDYTVVKPSAPRESGIIYYDGRTAVLDGQGGILVNSNGSNGPGSLDRVDLGTQALAWSLDAPITAGVLPVVDGANFYVWREDDFGRAIEKRRLSDGSVLNSVTLPKSNSAGLSLISTNNLLLVGTSTQIFAINKQTNAIVWTYGRGGHLSLSPHGVLYLARENGSLEAINLK